MITQTDLRRLSQLDNESLRQFIAYAAGIHSHRDRDNGEKMAEALRRIADRIEHKPMRRAG